MTRLETFTDAAFAFSAALLAISIDKVPSNYDELVVALQGAPAFAGSMLIILFFWYGHQRWSDRFGLEDLPSVILTFALIMMVMIYVYPLKILMESGFSFFSGGWLPSTFEFETFHQFRVLVSLYGLGFILLCSIMAGLYWHAWRLRDALAMCKEEAFDTWTEVIRWMFPVVFSMVIVALIWVLPDAHVSMVPFLFLLLAIFSPINDGIARRAAQRRFGPRS
ncbi:TMEM175 family protein [Wenzhouxiangella sp. EGI_FJ10409]|uniref:TMEM175 family protein n=1 Tax=Wenzhouxiangella sp. EGI_FJ10409 TaxID=3243767 RepID=UPI0035DEFF61